MNTSSKMSARSSSSFRELHRQSMAELFGYGIQESRKEAGLTIEEAAYFSGMKASEWRAIEEGTVPQEINQLRAMADAMQISFDKIANWVLLCRAAWEL